MTDKIKWEPVITRVVWDAYLGPDRVAQVTQSGVRYETYFNVTQPGDVLTDYRSGGLYDSLAAAIVAVEAALKGSQ